MIEEMRPLSVPIGHLTVWLAGLPVVLHQVEELSGGVLHFLVNNVGTNIRKPTVEYSEDE